MVCTIQSYVKDTTDFVNKLIAIDNLPDNALPVSLDVTSLYTKIPHNEGIDACRFILQKRTNKHIPTETICDLIRIILTMNNFTFNSKHYLQKHGTAMGTRIAPSYANLFLGKFERDALLNSPHQSYLCFRCIDDIFIIWTAGPEKLKIFVICLNNLRSTIKLAYSHSPSNIPFLHVMVSVKDGSIETDLYTKRTGKHQYLLVSCCHPQHTKCTIPFSLPLRLRRICSNPDNYKLRTNELIDYLANRGYGKTFLKTQIQRASDILRIYKQTQDSDDLYSTLLVITSILQFQNTFLPVIIPTIICF